MKKRSLIVLFVIYLAFIALGLPDALLGSAWNLTREDLNVPLAALGMVTMFSYALTLLATMNAPKILKYIQTKQVVFFSIIATSTALLLISQVTAFWQIIVLVIPLGMGAGAIDLSLNHYMAVHYKASHMNYLHSFYGLGVTFGPLIMAYTLQDNSWRMGYIIVGVILLIIALTVFFSFSYWDEETQEHREEHHTHIPLRQIFTTKGVLPSLVIFLVYVHIESLAGLFVASYFFLVKSISYSEAALFTMTYFLALTIGRLLSGFLSNKLRPETLIIGGELFIIGSVVLMFLPINQMIYYYLVVGLLGIGSGPIFPNMMYLNPIKFPKNTVSRVMSLQMAIGYLGFGLLTPLAGLLFQEITIDLYPYITGLAGIILIGFTLYFLQSTAQKKGSE